MRKIELVLALDVLEREKALDIANDVKDYISHIKVNYPLVLSCGVGIIGELSKIKPVIADFKIADIPYTSEIIARIAFENGAKAVIVHGFAGRETVKAVLNVAKEFDGEVYVVTELTSSEEFFKGISDKIAKMAVELGCHGIIAPSTRPERVKALKEIVGDIKILCPGIGAQGGSLEVVKYATHIIVGRAIYNSKNPKKSAEEIYKKLSQLD
ncbi:orotidine-5'-phosphate decarboxylase [Archaeoglobus profundus]|uniref:Orotidine 5'-phosphate decarboxylase n=1 Tax=Archaeoglobus profundus (strain DSM 5631 / JCM 9629 / NBRC 100127 / Av18) TaxID=572546 RepID=D2RHN4_ARCPA|nr:orotidine-5'-phosphate decarboxylase [Archaeoglobus profundus]ADB57809.1 orotidine 5'-phosphate decarboxylase [Archaeoglobus profundus DSM 5631]